MKHQITIDISGVRASGKTTIMLLMKQALANLGYAVKIPKSAYQCDQDAIVGGLEVSDTENTMITFTETICDSYDQEELEVDEDLDAVLTEDQALG